MTEDDYENTEDYHGYESYPDYFTGKSSLTSL